jgi:non-ribosomal peptide synthetase component E (peptide arylation enzyme)
MKRPETVIDELAIEKYTKEGQWRNKTLSDFLRDILERNPDEIAIVAGEHRLTYREIDHLSNNLARALRKMGITAGDVVSFQLPNWYQTAILNVALTKLGAVVNPIIPIYKEREVKFILSQAQSSALFIPDVFRGFSYIDMIQRIKTDLPDLKHVIVLGGEVREGTISMDSLLQGNGEPISEENIDPNDVKLLIYTSGTTAEPKGVQHTHNTLVCTALHDAKIIGLDENTITLMPSPVTHITGYCQALEFPFIVGSRAVLMDMWDAETALRLVEQEGCNYTIGATPFLQQMLDSPSLCPRKIASPFIFLCGGAYISPDLVQRAWDKAGWKTYRVYGATEAPTVTLGIGSRENAAETDGMVTNYAIQITDFEGQPLKFGEEGEIVVKGSKLFVGYRDPDLNQDAFGPGGWFHTGDLGKLSPEGYLKITGRKKDIIIRGGENISAAEIEDVLHLHPAIETAVAVAMPDSKMGEKVCAYVKVHQGLSLKFEEMIEFFEKHKITKQKWPERLEIVEDFPMTASGKIKKHILRKDISEKIGLSPV